MKVIELLEILRAEESDYECTRNSSNRYSSPCGYYHNPCDSSTDSSYESHGCSYSNPCDGGSYSRSSGCGSGGSAC